MLLFLVEFLIFITSKKAFSCMVPKTPDNLFYAATLKQSQYTTRSASVPHFTLIPTRLVENKAAWLIYDPKTYEKNQCIKQTAFNRQTHTQTISHNTNMLSVSHSNSEHYIKI
ncbi:hypothetical protein EGW08_018089 [Elysia chlorotica]|uniref:Secreted protein n=1 Tax=Elysia chlorotica TaxID=188477 RepID=A0A3S1AWN5_ELYCH|nr:hypothetical protein EGW08_018089 [Elysia chlorotica]